VNAALVAVTAAGIAAATMTFHTPAASASAPTRQATDCGPSPTPACPDPTPQTQQRRPTQCGPGLPPCPSN
jgi:hypothetical protein